MASLLDKRKISKAQKTRSKILDSAKTLFIEKGINNVSVQDIVKLAGLGHGTFYLYFKDKRNVFDKLLEQVEDDLFTAFNGGVDLQKDYERGLTAYRALRKDLAAIFKSFQKHNDVIKLSYELAMIDEVFANKFAAMRARLIDRVVTILIKSQIREHWDTHIAAVAIAGMIESSAEHWLKNSKDKTNAETELEFNKLLSTVSKIYFKLVS